MVILLIAIGYFFIEDIRGYLLFFYWGYRWLLMVILAIGYFFIGDIGGY
jgi:hypothetical protein